MPGDTKIEKLFEDVNFGLYLRGRGTKGREVNPSIGTFVFSVGSSYTVRNSKVTKIVRGVSVCGSILGIFKGCRDGL